MCSRADFNAKTTKMINELLKVYLNYVTLHKTETEQQASIVEILTLEKHQTNILFIFFATENEIIRF